MPLAQAAQGQGAHRLVHLGDHLHFAPSRGLAQQFNLHFLGLWPQIGQGSGHLLHPFHAQLLRPILEHSAQRVNPLARILPLGKDFAQKMKTRLT